MKLAQQDLKVNKDSKVSTVHKDLSVAHKVSKVSKAQELRVMLDLREQQVHKVL